MWNMERSAEFLKKLHKKIIFDRVNFYIEIYPDFIKKINISNSRKYREF